MEQNNYKFSDLAYLCIKFKNDPSNEEILKEISNTIQNYQIRSYMPLIQKQLCALSILSTIENDPDPTELGIIILCAKIYFGIFGYVVNLELDIDFKLITPIIIDALYELDVIDSILGFCEKDFNRLDKMIQEMINFSNIQQLCAIPGLINEEKLDELTKAVYNLKSGMSPQAISDLAKISLETSSEWKELKDTLSQNIQEGLFYKSFQSIAPEENNKEKG